MADLVREMDLSTVEEVNPSFLSEGFQLNESDLLLKVQASDQNLAEFITIFRRILIYAENTRKDLRQEKEDLFELLKGADAMRKTSVERWEERIRMEAVDAVREDILEKGIEKGIEKGRSAEKQSIAQKMKSLGFAVDDIQKVTGLML